MPKKEERGMIYYFSGTGNSKWAAEQLAAKTGETAVNIMTLSAPPSADAQTIGFVFPIHAWGAPEPMLEFARKLTGKPAFAFGVCTCGGEAGAAMEKFRRIFPLDSVYSIVMPNNYVMGSELESEESILRKVRAAKERLDVIAAQIRAKQPVSDVQTGSLAWLESSLVNLGFNFAARSTRPFYVTDRCISCGQCARDCPAHSITMVEGKPRWGNKCYQCTACINLCSTRAIEYGKGTAARGRYSFVDVS